ncbi:hypothetical protein BURKHO8Y_210626 [Burkholderia sp. 8Y]|nr:hypothetical protein BURKHO8Y_210626 [Burkholderia sp. 8Y]
MVASRMPKCVRPNFPVDSTYLETLGIHGFHGLSKSATIGKLLPVNENDGSIGESIR